jgi:HK97 family phage portal protein
MFLTHASTRQHATGKWKRFWGRIAKSPKSGRPMSYKDLFTDSLLSNGLRSYMVMPGQPVWMERNYAQFAVEAYVRNVVGHRAMGMVSGAGASIKFRLYASGPKGTRRELRNHPMLDLINRPNPTQSRSEFFQALYQYRLISGNAFIQAVGPNKEAPGELHLLRPDRMAVLAGKAAMPSGYRYTVNSQYTDFPVDRLTGRSRILHIKTFHPLNDWYGLSPVEAAAYSIDQHNQAGAWNQALLQNGARPSGALVVKADSAGSGTLSEDQYTRVKMQIDEQFTGSANAGRPLLLEGGLDWKEMSLSPKDMDFIEAKNSSARDIAQAFGVPPQLLGIPGDNTYSNLQEARLALWEQTVVPMVAATADAMNAWLSGMFGGQFELVPDTDGISALATRNQAIWDRVESASFLTDDEKRAAVGYGPLARSA